MYFPLELFAFPSMWHRAPQSTRACAGTHSRASDTSDGKTGMGSTWHQFKGHFPNSVPKTGPVQWGRPWLQGNLQKELQRTSGGWEKKENAALQRCSSSYGGTESPSLKGEMQVTGMADHSPTQQLLPPGSQRSHCGTNPSFTQDLQNAPKDEFFLNRLHQVKGLAESKGRVLPTTIYPQGTGHLTRLNSLTPAPTHFGGVRFIHIQKRQQ